VSIEAKECAECASMPGSPILCESCLHNRNLASEYSKLVSDLTILIGDWRKQADRSYTRGQEANDDLPHVAEGCFATYQSLTCCADQLKRLIKR
jgi:hypothetical protein